MYVRTKQIPPDEGNWYRYLVRAERKNDQVQQKVVKYLGKATGPDDHSIHEDDNLDDLPDDIEDKLGTTEEDVDFDLHNFEDRDSKIVKVDGKKVRISDTPGDTGWYRIEEDEVTMENPNPKSSIVGPLVSFDGFDGKWATVHSEYEAKDDIKDMDYEETERRWSSEANVWKVKNDKESLEEAVGTLRDKGYTVKLNQNIMEKFEVNE